MTHVHANTSVIPLHPENAHGKQDVKIVLPLPPQNAALMEEMEIYVRFFRHLRHVPHSRTDIKILSSIQFTADFLDHSDAHIAKVLVDLGLRAPRMAFPADFLRFVDDSLHRSGWEIGAPTESIIELKLFWDKNGDDKFAAFKRDYSLVDEMIGV
ncbi:MAG: hypothetical protein LRZ85_03065 [Alphaproteobacteria bacterium]|nr:hypothetical protein [Alphaproteobacteria bacterium]MCD8526168.1 hypothetical protein [Alphaproteobacteria bacterium]